MDVVVGHQSELRGLNHAMALTRLGRGRAEWSQGRRFQRPMIEAALPTQHRKENNLFRVAAGRGKDVKTNL